MIAGDLDCPLQRAVDRIARDVVFHRQAGHFVPGNHEFNGSDLAGCARRGRGRAAATPAFTCSTVALRSSAAFALSGRRLDGLRAGRDTRANMIRQARDADHKAIRYREANGHISRFMHGIPAASTSSIEPSSSTSCLFHGGSTVVVTHHLPSARSIATRFMGSPLNPAFASNLAHLIETHRLPYGSTDIVIKPWTTGSAKPA